MADEFEKEENDAGTAHDMKRMSVDDVHKMSMNLKPAGHLSFDQDQSTYNQNIAEKATKQE